MRDVLLSQKRGLIWSPNRCPGSDTRVAWCRWTMLCGARGPRLESRGNPPFDPSLFEDMSGNGKGARRLGLRNVWRYFRPPMSASEIIWWHESPTGTAIFAVNLTFELLRVIVADADTESFFFVLSILITFNILHANSNFDFDDIVLIQGLLVTGRIS